MTIEELFHQVLPRLSGAALCSIFEAVREVQGIIANRLLLRKSELLVKDAPAELVFAVGEQKKTLPADFATLEGRPYVKGEKQLWPLAGMDTLSLQEAGKAKYYEVVGKTLRLYPPVAAETTVQVPYFFKPPVLTALSATLPFEGEFDGVFVEGCVALASKGLVAVADRGWVAVIQSQVDAVLEAKELVAEQLMADAINER